ncbi:MAG: hypothetical protein ACI4XJ_06560 [Eubacteriales bacterium]
MQKRQIVNIVNFIRAVEPRVKMDLIEPVVEQIKLMKKHGLRGTFLVQYDTLGMPEFTDILKELDPEQFELGVWHEIVEPMCADCGIRWTGRFPWDWHVHCGFSLGYTKEEREKLADALFEKFRSVFGYYPRSFGSWLFDTHTVRYIAGKYELDAICNCKEQYGTDGYTLWGGYYGQGYYPSANNVFMPAQSEETEIRVPLFRMLGSDPVYQYDFGTSAESGAQMFQGVITLEPVYCSGGGGGNKKWVDWYLKENFNGDCLSFGYAQAGQENSFGWKSMKDGLEYQFEKFAQMQKEGKLCCETLGDTGRWYKETYETTPPSAITAHDAWDDGEKRSVWYSSKKYRVNLFSDKNGVRIRDLHIFSDSFADPYEDKVCDKNEATYESLPAVDGNRFSGNGVLAGAYITKGGKAVENRPVTFEEVGDTARVSFGDIVFTLTENSVSIELGECEIENRIGKDEACPTVAGLSSDKITLRYAGCTYSIKLGCGKFADENHIRPENGRITVIFE